MHEGRSKDAGNLTVLVLGVPAQESAGGPWLAIGCPAQPRHSSIREGFGTLGTPLGLAQRKREIGRAHV